MKKILLLLILFGDLFGAEKDRRAYPPFITGDGFRSYCDYIFDDACCTIKVDEIEEGSTIFVKTDFLPLFFDRFHNSIKCKYILVTHNSDLPIPGHFANYLDDEKLIAWFGQNVEKAHPKLHPLPIGLENRYNTHGDLSVLENTRQKSKDCVKQDLVYLNFSLSTWPERQKAFDYFKQLSFCKQSEPKPYRDYLTDLARSYFTASPRGNGLDCHRTWEALYMGSIPIIKSSAINSLFNEMPVLIVNDWEDISLEVLLKIASSKGIHKLEKLELGYWLAQIESYRCLQD